MKMETNKQKQKKAFTFPTSYSNRFVCKYCHKSFVQEQRYFNHKCKQMKQLEELQSPIGQAAFEYYQTWFKCQKKMPPQPSSFIDSHFFRTFINFATHVHKVKLPRPDSFIWLMTTKEIRPTIWCNDAVYSIYIEFLDRQTSPVEQAAISVQTLLDYADKHEINVENIFETIKPTEIITLLRARQLSPWLLLRSKKFKHFFKDRLSQEQQIILETFIRADYWAEKLQNNEGNVKIIDMFIHELNI